MRSHIKIYIKTKLKKEMLHFKKHNFLNNNNYTFLYILFLLVKTEESIRSKERKSERTVV